MDRRIRILLVLGLLIAMGALTLIGDEPEAQIGVDELMEDPDARAGEDVHIRGAIVNGTLDVDNATTVLSGIFHTVELDFRGLAIPDGMNEGKTIAVRGTLEVSEDGYWTIHAKEIKTGCPSKYEATAGEAVEA